MKKIFSTLTILISIGATVSVAQASDDDILATFDKMGYTSKQIRIEQSEIKSLKMVTTPDAIFYTTDDGKFITQGPIYNIEGSRAKDIANANYARLVASIDKDAIVYKAKNEKFVISVFTDYTCTYCKKLHNEIDSYLDAGITIHYFAFPRQGLDSPIAKDMQSIWSAKDRKAAFDNAYKGGTISPASSLVPYVEMQYKVGHQIGISGTPAIILPSGEVLSGYVPAETLLKILNNTN